MSDDSSQQIGRVRAEALGCLVSFGWQWKKYGPTVLLVDLLLDVEVDAGDDDVGDDVERAHAVEHIRVIERYLL